MTHRLEIDGLHFGDIEADKIRQTYTEVPGGVTRRRLANGTLNVRSAYEGKVKTTITGKGVLPPGLDTLDTRTIYTLKCVGYRTLSSSLYTMGASLPGHRADVPVIYTEWKNGVLLPWDGVSDDGAEVYRATYVPQLTVNLTQRTVGSEYLGNEWDWSLTFEEAA